MHQAGAQLPWRHITVLLDRLDDAGVREWYAVQAVEHGWSRNVLEHQIMSGLHGRIGAAPSNAHLTPAQSELAQQLTRDPYVFDHLGLTERASERALEQALMDRLQGTLTAFGHGMAFVGRQVRFDVGCEVLVVELLLFHVTQLRYVVVELKIGRFSPAYVGQLGTMSLSLTTGCVITRSAPPLSGCCCAPVVTSRWCAARWLVPVRRWLWRPTRR